MRKMTLSVNIAMKTRSWTEWKKFVHNVNNYLSATEKHKRDDEI